MRGDCPRLCGKEEGREGGREGRRSWMCDRGPGWYKYNTQKGRKEYLYSLIEISPVYIDTALLPTIPSFLTDTISHQK